MKTRRLSEIGTYLEAFDADAIVHPHIIVASNRGPANFYRRANGQFVARGNSGGLATALIAAAAQAQISWIAVAGDENDRLAFADRPRRLIQIGDSRITARYIAVPDRMYHLYYNEISNRILWFLQHYMIQPDAGISFNENDRRAWDEGYIPVNRYIADAIIAEFEALDPEEQERTIVMVQDYHLYLVPGMLRQALPDITVGHFTHIPWPTARYLQFLPHDFVQQIMMSMVENDVVGFQTAMDMENFLGCTAALLPNTHIIRHRNTGRISWQGRRTLARVYPIAIDPVQVKKLAKSPAGQRAIAPYQRHFKGVHTILRVDRLEPTKNIVRGLQAFEDLIEQYPELRQDVRFVQILVPSREGVLRYRRYAQQVTKLVQKINAKYASPEEPIVIVISGNHYARALAAMRLCDVMIVNSVIDGMHLGAKEAAVLGERNTVLVVSRNAGVYQELGNDACLGITPTDLLETTQALYTALTMPTQERQAMATRARDISMSRTVIDWLHEQVEDLKQLKEPLATSHETTHALDSLGEIIQIPWTEQSQYHIYS